MIRILRDFATMTQSSPVSSQTGKVASKIRVLVVDDDEDAAKGVAELLEAEGHTVAITHDLSLIHI